MEIQTSYCHRARNNILQEMVPESNQNLDKKPANKQASVNCPTETLIQAKGDQVEVETVQDWYKLIHITE